MTRSRSRYAGAGTLVGSLIEIDELMSYRKQNRLVDGLVYSFLL
jgi:hypothetical protein